MGINVLSVCNGISCGAIALDRAGIKVDNYFSSEIDKYANQVSQHHYPNIIQLGDINKINGNDLPKIDLMIGGFPCQSYSICGKQLNFEDPRGKIFFECVRLLRECKPKYFFFENVKMKKEYSDVMDELFGVKHVEVNSALLSAQNRKRIYWTNIPFIGLPEDNGIMLSSILKDEIDEKYYISTEKSIQILDNEVKRGKIGFIENDSKWNRVYSIHGKSVTIMSNGGGWGAKTGLYWFPIISPNRVKKKSTWATS